MFLSRLTARSAGIVLYLVGIFFFALNDALGKWLMTGYGVGQLMLVRSFAAGLIIVPLVWRSNEQVADFRQWRLKLLRVLCLAGDSFSFFLATKSMPLADVMTYYMAAPLIITALCVPLLRERVEMFRWVAVLAGFAGVAIALQPSSAAFSPSALIALFGATMFAVAMTLTRLIRDTHWLPLVAWQFSGAALIGAATSPIAWVTPTYFDIALMVLTGVAAMVCFTCVTRAFRLAPASLLAPFQYTALVWAMLMGWLVWRDVPTVPILIGNAVIIASGLYVWFKEARGRIALESRDLSS